MIKHLEDLRALHRQRRLVPFIGGGVSRAVNLPDWSALIGLLADDLGFERGVFNVHGNYLQLAQFYTLERSKAELRGLISKHLHPDPALVAASRTHKALATGGFDTNYTTNFDDLIETAMQQAGTRHSVIRTFQDLVAMAPGDGSQVVKFHGDLASDDGIIVLTEADYFDRMDFEGPLDIKLRADMLNKSLLFVGYSLRDINIRYMLYKVVKLRRTITKKVSAFAFFVTFPLGEVQRALLSSWSIEPVELDGRDKSSSTADFLEALLG